MKPTVDEKEIDSITARSAPGHISPWLEGLRLGSLANLARQVLRLIRQDANDEESVTQLRVLVKSSAIYAIASLVLPLMVLILAPFLTHTLTRNDYGVLAVLNTAITLTVGVSQFGLNNAFFRAFSYDYVTQTDKRAVLATVSTLLALFSVPITLTLCMTAPWLSWLLFNSPAYTDPVRLAALVVLLQNLTVPGFSWLRAESRAGYYAVLSVANLLINLAATIFFVGVLHMGLTGALFALAGGYLIVVLCTLPVVLLRAGLSLRLDICWNLLSFGLPLVANTVSIWVLQLSDRYLLGRLGSLAQVASYTVAYSLGGILGVVVLSPFSLAWPTAMYAIAKRDGARALFRQVFHWYSLFLLFATFGLVLGSMGVLVLFFPPAYATAMPVIPIVALSILFFGLYSYFTLGISLRRKTWWAVTLTTLAALANVALNLCLIPLSGSLGAALSTLIAYTLLAIAGYAVNQRLYPISFGLSTFLIALCAGIALYGGCSALIATQHVPDGYAIALYTCTFVAYSGALLLLAQHPDWIGTLKDRQTRKDSPL